MCKIKFSYKLKRVCKTVETFILDWWEISFFGGWKLCCFAFFTLLLVNFVWNNFCSFFAEIQLVLFFLYGGAIMAENNEKIDVQTEVVWNDANMKNTYVNATNVVAGREEVIMLLGVNNAWQRGQEKVNVDIAERVMMTPFTAKRLAIMLSATLRAYESKYGTIDIGLPTANKEEK